MDSPCPGCRQSVRARREEVVGWAVGGRGGRLEAEVVHTTSARRRPGFGGEWGPRRENE